MTQQNKETLLAAFMPLWRWFTGNLTVLIAFASLSWQISSKVGPVAYNKVWNFVDSANVARVTARQVQRDLSEYKVEQLIVNNRQDSSIQRLITQNIK